MPITEPHSQGEIEPHDDEHCHHHVQPWWKYLLILMVLLFFTLLTVGLAQFETWITDTFPVHLDTWVNVVVAMSIAVIKGTLVALYFMQLRYSNYLNTFAMLFCLVGVALFLGFSMLDLGSRHMVNEWKAGEITDGGTGWGMTRLDDSSFSGPIVLNARERAIDRVPAGEHGSKFEHNTQNAFNEKGLYAFDGDEAAFEAYAESLHSGHHGAIHDHVDISDGSHSIRRTGLTPGLFDKEAHTAEHDDHGPSGHAESEADHGSEESHGAEGAQESSGAGGH